MNIVLIGASGFIGSALRRELLARGHQVNALVSNPARLEPAANLAVTQVDVLDTDALAGALHARGRPDAVVTAFSGHANADVRGYYVRGFRSILAAVRRTPGLRLVAVGGAGSLEVAPGTQLLDTPQFPDAYKATAEGARDALQLLRAEPELDWTMLSPPAMLAPGRRTGRFRFGVDQLIVGAAGKSEISVEDYAVALIDEVERPQNRRRRFTVGY